MDQTIALAEEVHKGTEVDDFDNFAVIDLTFFGLGDDCIDHVIGFFDRVTVWRSNFDHALIVDVDLRTRDFNNFADNLAARTDHFANFIGWYIHGLDAWGMDAEIGRFGQ